MWQTSQPLACNPLASLDALIHHAGSLQHLAPEMKIIILMDWAG